MKLGSLRMLHAELQSSEIFRGISHPRLSGNTYICVCCRNLNYWDSVSTLAGEVANPHKTFPLALMLAVVLVILMYLLPLLACLGVMTETSDWKLGFFATVARQVGGQWLAWWMLAAAAVSHLPLI